MKLGLQISSFTWPGGDAAIADTLARVCTTADEAGFDSIWVMDHLFQIRSVGDVEEPMLYDPARPSRATTLDHLPGQPRVTDDGRIEVRGRWPGAWLHLLFLPLLVLGVLVVATIVLV